MELCSEIWRRADGGGAGAGAMAVSNKKGRGIMTIFNAAPNALITRRTALLGTAGALAMPYIANAAAAEPIKLGMIWAKTGQIVEQAEYLAQGTMLALEQRQNMLLGRPVELIWLDEPNPQGAQQNAERLVGEHKVSGIVGGALSSFALAISSVAAKSKTPYVAANAAASAITGSSCNRYTFRLQPPVPVHTNVLAPYCAALGKKWYIMTAAYAFGQDIKKSFTDYITSHGGTVVGADEVPVGTPDYSSYILKIRAAKPDVIVEHLSELRVILEQNDFTLGNGRATLPRRRAKKNLPQQIPTAFPITTVGALIFNSKNEVLMLRTHKWSNKWGIPGGKIKLGETSEAALRREIKEETNLKVNQIQFVLVQDCIHSKEFYKDAHFVLLNYTCRVTGKANVKLNHEAQEFRWLKIADAKKLKLNKPTKILLEAVRSKRTR
jgi:ADP-ribose pyrophosphatase YjhB (NUDIX family)